MNEGGKVKCCCEHTAGSAFLAVLVLSRQFNENLISRSGEGEKGREEREEEKEKQKMTHENIHHEAADLLLKRGAWNTQCI